MAVDGFSPAPRISYSDWRTVFLIALLLTAASITVHLFIPSTLHLTTETWNEIRDFHHAYEPFRVRPLTTNLIEFMATILGISFKYAFLGFQFAMYFACGVIFYRFLRHLSFTHIESVAGFMIFSLAVPVFLANLEPMHTWDDF